MSYCPDNQTSVKVEVYDWDGNAVGSNEFTGVTLGANVSFNVQSIFFHEGNTYAIACSWTSGHMKVHLWRVTCDLSVLE